MTSTNQLYMEFRAAKNKLNNFGILTRTKDSCWKLILKNEFFFESSMALDIKIEKKLLKSFITIKNNHDDDTPSSYYTEKIFSLAYGLREITRLIQHDFNTFDKIQDRNNGH